MAHSLNYYRPYVRDYTAAGHFAESHEQSTKGESGSFSLARGRCRDANYLALRHSCNMLARSSLEHARGLKGLASPFKTNQINVFIVDNKVTYKLNNYNIVDYSSLYA